MANPASDFFATAGSKLIFQASMPSVQVTGYETFLYYNGNFIKNVGPAAQSV